MKSSSPVGIRRLQHKSVEEPKAVATLDHVTKRVLDGIELRRQTTGAGLDPTSRSQHGQYFTPPDVAAFMAQLLEVRSEPTRLLDPGAGVGSLTAAVVQRWTDEGGGPLRATAVEYDSELAARLHESLHELTSLGVIEAAAVRDDFVSWATNHLTGFGLLDAPRFDVAILNPPYRKIGNASAERRALSAAGIEAPNLYAGFVALAAELLDTGGQMVAITPRSFTNGPYFRRFRHYLLDRIGLRRLHVFDSRSTAFADNDVLQENVILYGVRGGGTQPVLISSSDSATSEVRSRTADYTEVVRPEDKQAFIHIAPDEDSAECARRVLDLPLQLAGLGVAVSTGAVVAFRAKEHLRQDWQKGCVPLLYPGHLRDGGVEWPRASSKKPNAIVHCAETEKLLMPAGTYVVVKRFTSKEEPRRIVASVVSADLISHEHFAFENHLNVFHSDGEGMPDDLAQGLAAFLNTTTVDQYFRQFNGHTQVNATDLRSLQYPDAVDLRVLGSVAPPGASQNEIDQAAEEVLSTFSPVVLERTA